MPDVELAAGTISYDDTGGDGPVVVLRHGLAIGQIARAPGHLRPPLGHAVRGAEAAARRASPANVAGSRPYPG